MAIDTEAREEHFARNTRPLDSAESRMMHIELLRPSGRNPRKDFDEAALLELTESLKTHGMLEPIVVRRIGAGATCEIIAGERRWRAARMAALPEVPVRIIDVDDDKAIELALVENLARRDINPIEEAEGYAQLLELGYTEEKIADAVNRSQGAISNTVRLLNHSEPIRQKVRDGKITATHARAMLPFVHSPEIVDAMAEAAETGATTKDLERFDLGDLLPWDKVKALPVRSIDKWDTKFDRAPCSSCPKQRKNWCTDPQCYDLKQAEAKSAKEAEVQAQLADAGSELDLTQLSHDQWRRLDPENPLQGCGLSCEHRRTAVYYGNIIHCCFKPECCDALEQQRRDAMAAERERTANQSIDRAVETLRDTDTMSRTAALAVWRTVAGADAKHATRASEILGLDVDIKLVTKNSWCQTAEQLAALQELSRFSPVQQMMFGALVKLIGEAWQPTGSVDGPIIEWYHGESLADVIGSMDIAKRLEEAGIVEDGQVKRKDGDPATPYWVLKADADGVELGDADGNRLVTISAEAALEQFEETFEACPDAGAFGDDDAEE